MKRGNLIVKLLIVVCVLALGGVSQAAELTVLRPGTRDKVASFLEPAIKQFEQDNPDIKVNILYGDWNEYLTRLATWIAAGEAPDVFMANDHTMPYYADQGAFLPLDDFIDKGLIDPELRTEIPEALWPAGRWNGKTYLIPTAVGGIMNFWHKDLFRAAGLDPDRAPATVEEFLDYAIKLTKPPESYGYALTMRTWDTGWEEEVSIFYHAFTDQPWFDEDGSILFDTPEAREAFRFVIDLANEHKAIYPNPFEYDRGEMRPIFRDKKVAMHTDGPWYYPMLAENFDFSSQEASEVGIGLVPRKGKRSSMMGADGWVIYSGTKYPKEAARLLDWLVSEEVQYNHGTLYGVAPSQRRLYNKGEYQNWYWKPQIETIETAFPRAHTTFTQEFYIEAFKYTQLAMTKQMSVDAAFDAIVKVAKQLSFQ